MPTREILSFFSKDFLLENDRRIMRLLNSILKHKKISKKEDTSCCIQKLNLKPKPN